MACASWYPCCSPWACRAPAGRSSPIICLRGRIVQGQISDDPNLVTGLSYFMLEVETDASVSYVDFMTAMGQYGEIPADEHTTSGEIETYHWVDGSTHVWEYWGYFENPDTLHNYGDGSVHSRSPLRRRVSGAHDRLVRHPRNGPGDPRRPRCRASRGRRTMVSSPRR